MRRRDRRSASPNANTSSSIRWSSSAAGTGCTDEERGRIMKSHIEVGRRHPEITINTTYSFGLDDQEFVVAFEGDDPGEFLDLVQELRPTESSAFTERETPIFTCVAMSPRKALDALDGTPSAARCAATSRTRVPYPSASEFHHEQGRHPREPRPRRDRRRRPVRLLRRRAHPQGRGDPCPGRSIRSAPDPVRPRPRRRRPRPSQDQLGDPRLREDRGPRGLPILRQRQGRPRHRGRGPRAPLPRDRLHVRLRDRPPARHPGRRPARQPRRDGVRRLVQRHPDYCNEQFDLSCERAV